MDVLNRARTATILDSDHRQFRRKPTWTKLGKVNATAYLDACEGSGIVRDCFYEPSQWQYGILRKSNQQPERHLAWLELYLLMILKQHLNMSQTIRREMYLPVYTFITPWACFFRNSRHPSHKAGG